MVLTAKLYAGPTFEVITNADTGQVIGNYTLVYTQLDANTLEATLPSSFNASQLLGAGNYTAVFTYSGTSNFFDPTPLTVQFSIMVCLLPKWKPWLDLPSRNILHLHASQFLQVLHNGNPLQLQVRALPTSCD